MAVRPSRPVFLVWPAGRGAFVGDRAMGRLMHRKVKVVQVVNPALASTTSAGTAQVIDTHGYEEVLLIVPIGVMNNVTLNIDVQHSDAAGSGFATVPAPVSTTINPRKLSMTNADVNTSVVAYLDLSGLKRYIKPLDSLNANYATYGMIAVLFGPEDSARTDNVNQSLEADST